MEINSTQPFCQGKVDEVAVHSTSWLTAANIDMLVLKLPFRRKFDEGAGNR